MKILYILPYVPSPIRVRPYQIIRALAKAGHQVTVAALSDTFATEAATAELRDICDAVHIVPHSRMRGATQSLLALPSATPLWAAYCHSPAMDAKLRALVANNAFDVAHIEHLRAAHFVSALGTLPTVFDAVDCLTALRKQMMNATGSTLSRIFSWEEWIKLRTYEPQQCHRFSQIAITSERNKAALLDLDHGLPPVHVLTNGVDNEYFRPNPSVAPEPDTIVFSGKMSYTPNDDAARFLLQEIVPRLRGLRPHVKVVIVGSKPSPALRALATHTGNVTVTGFVEDIRPYLSRATIAVCPLRIGVGIQNKVLESMALGRPVVCSSLAADAVSEAVSANAGVYVADTPQAFATICAQLLSIPPSETDALGRAARTYVETYHRWSTVAHGFVDLYHKAITC